MSAALALPPFIDSPLGRLDARWRLAALVVAGLTVTTLRTLPVAVAALIGAAILAGVARLPRRWAAARLSGSLLVVLPFALWLPLVGGAPGVWFGPLWLSDAGTRSAALLLLKSASLGLVVLTGLVAAPLPTTLKAARALHVPGPLVQLVVLTLRYAFVLSAELDRLRVALRVRGYRNRVNLHSYRTIGHIAGTLLVRGSERAERVGQAMRCRGFDGQYRALTDFRTRLADVAVFVLIVGAAALLGADVIGRFDTPREDALLPHSRPAAMTEPAIRVDGLTYRYADGAPALDGVRFEVGVGERVGLVGPNGAGKTTLFLCLSGVLRGRGVVRLAGLDPADPKQRRQLPARVGIIFQDSDDQVFNATVFDDVAFGPLNLGLSAEEVRRRVAEALAGVGLTGFEGRVPFHLSGGERRRVALAGVLAMRPEILLLDEPSLHLDPRGRRELIRLINGLPVTQVVAAHDLELILETCARTLVIDGGRVVADGAAKELLADAALMEAHGLEVPYSLRPSSQPTSTLAEGGGNVTVSIPQGAGRLPAGATIVEIDPHGFWIRFRTAAGREMMRFRPDEAVAYQPPLRHRNFTPDREVGVDPHGRADVLEGVHRAVGVANEGATIPPEFGGVPDARGWLDYPYYGRTSGGGALIRGMRNPPPEPGPVSNGGAK